MRCFYDWPSLHSQQSVPGSHPATTQASPRPPSYFTSLRSTSIPSSKSTSRPSKCLIPRRFQTVMLYRIQCVFTLFDTKPLVGVSCPSLYLCSVRCPVFSRATYDKLLNKCCIIQSPTKLKPSLVITTGIGRHDNPLRSPSCGHSPNTGHMNEE